jgi:hypothetical protein
MKRTLTNSYFGVSFLTNRKSRHWRRVLCGLVLIILWCAVSVSVVHGQAAWVAETVDGANGGDVGKYTNLVIDNHGNFHIGYFDEGHNALRYAYRGVSDKQWYTMQVDSQAGQYASLAVDAHDRPHFAYNARVLTGLHYAYWDGTRWRIHIIDHDRTNHFTSIQMDANDYPHISYYQEENDDGTNALRLKYAYFDGSTWYTETVNRKFATGKFNSIALDSSGRPHIAYSFAAIGDLGYVFWDGSQWVYQVPDTRRTHNDYVGTGNSIVLDTKGNPHIAYFDLNSRKIKYTRWTGSAWQTEFVDEVVGSLTLADHVSLKLDGHDRPHVAYYDSGLGVLKYAVRDDQGWHVEVVDNHGNVGEYPSLCFDQHEQPYITYYDLSDRELRLAHRESEPSATMTTDKHTNR